MLLLDALLVGVSYVGSYFLRYEGQIPKYEWGNIHQIIYYLVPFKIIIFILFGLYKGMWRYTSLVDLFGVLRATAISSVGVILAILFIYRFEGFPRSVFVIDWFLTFLLVGGVRVLIRVSLAERGSIKKILSFGSRSENPKNKKVLLIIGAGDAGEKMLREIRDNPRLNYEVLGFLDDDPRKHNMKIHGVPVFGPIAKIHELAYRAEVDEILVAIPSATTKQMKTVVQHCEATGLKIHTTPGIGELIDGKISFSSIREVSFEDILGRDPVNLDMERIGEYLTGKVVLVSGAGGSIGSELCRQISSFGPRNLVLLDKTENSLFHVEMEFRQKFPDILITPILGSVKHQSFLDQLFEIHRPQVVFHAAAYKHVPIVELNPWEAIFNNVIGTNNIVEAAHKFQIRAVYHDVHG